MLKAQEALGRVKGVKGGSWKRTLHTYDYTYETVTGRATAWDEEELLFMANRPEYQEEKIVSVSFYKKPLPGMSDEARVLVHHFITFETSRLTRSGEIKTYYSIEKNQGSINLQKSNSEEELTENLAGKPRERPASLLFRSEGWGASLHDAAKYLSNTRAFSDKYNIWTGNCQHFAANMFKFLALNTAQNPPSISPIVGYLENPIDGPIVTLESDDDEFSLSTGLVEPDSFFGLAREYQIKTECMFGWEASYTVSTQRWNEGLVLFVEIQGKQFRLWRRKSTASLPHLVLTHWSYYADEDFVYASNPPDSLDIIDRFEDEISHFSKIRFSRKGKILSLLLRFEFVEPLTNSETKETAFSYLDSLKNGPSDPSFLSSAESEVFFKVRNPLCPPEYKRSSPYALFSSKTKFSFGFGCGFSKRKKNGGLISPFKERM